MAGPEGTESGLRLQTCSSQVQGWYSVNCYRPQLQTCEEFRRQGQFLAEPVLRTFPELDVAGSLSRSSRLVLRDINKLGNRNLTAVAYLQHALRPWYQTLSRSSYRRPCTPDPNPAMREGLGWFDVPSIRLRDSMPPNTARPNKTQCGWPGDGGVGSEAPRPGGCFQGKDLPGSRAPGSTPLPPTENQNQRRLRSKS